MTDLATLTALRDNVATLKGPDREVDRLLWLALPDEYSDVLRPEQRPSLTDSLDAVDALRERVLPKGIAIYGPDPLARAPAPWRVLLGLPGHREAAGIAETAPLAYLLAVLNALIAKETP